MSFSYANEATSNDYLAEEEAPAEEDMASAGDE